MIRIELICCHVDEPRARDAKRPCESTRNNNVVSEKKDSMKMAAIAAEAVAKRRGWKQVLIRIGQYKGWICPNCFARKEGEI